MLRIFAIALMLAGGSHLAAQVAELPFELHGSHIVVSLRINDGAEPVPFVFDTGASAVAIDAGFAKAQNWKAGGRETATGAGGSQSYPIVRNQTIHLNESVALERVTFALVDLAPLQERIGIPFVGIIGADVLNRFVVRLDYGERTLGLFEDVRKIDTNGYSTVDFRFGATGRIPEFEVAIELTNGERLEGKVLLDTGANVSLLMNTPFKERHGVREKVEDVFSRESRNLSTSSSTEYASLGALMIGPFRFENLYMGLSSDKAGVSSGKGLGILGNRVLKRFDMVLDYSRKRVLLKPNETFGDPFEPFIGGISLLLRDGCVLIDRVHPTSNAYEAGLRSGDEILSLDKISGTDLREFRRLLRQEGRTVELSIRRGKRPEPVVLRFELERLL